MISELFQTRPFAKFATIGLVAFGVMTLTFAASNSERLFRAEVKKPAPGAANKPDRPPSQKGPRAKSNHVSRAGLQPRLRDALGVMGNRLEEGGGKERLMFDGTLRVGGHGSPMSVRVIRELGDKIYFERKGAQRSSLNFNGQKMRKLGDMSDVADESLIETLLNDSAEHFFAGQFEGFPTRLLGYRFRLDDGTDENYSGPFYDVYQVEDQIKVSGDLHRRVKLYHFNSDTRLLERVRYQTERDGMPIEVEVVLGDWQRVQGEMVPRQITRVEAGVMAFILRVEAMSLSPRAEDGLFSSTDKK